jgi:GNAT superfamily N-acetyltransferase
MKLFSHEVVQKQWASVDYRKNMSIIGLVQRGGHQEIVAIGTYAQDTEDKAEVAFVVREDFQNFGIASYLLKTLEAIAQENGYRFFSASVLRENLSMIKVFKKRYPNAEVTTSGGGELSLLMAFSEAVENGEADRSGA